MKNEKVKERAKQMGVEEAKELSWRKKLHTLATSFSCLILAVALLQRARVLRFGVN